VGYKTVIVASILKTNACPDITMLRILLAGAADHCSGPFRGQVQPFLDDLYEQHSTSLKKIPILQQLGSLSQNVLHFMACRGVPQGLDAILLQ
jgi:hypothetical protein